MKIDITLYRYQKIYKHSKHSERVWCMSTKYIREVKPQVTEWLKQYNDLSKS